MQQTAMDFGTGVMIGGLALSACWGWLWLLISTVGLVRGVCRLRVVRNSMIVGIIPVLLGWGLWWMPLSGQRCSAALAMRADYWRKVYSSRAAGDGKRSSRLGQRRAAA